MMKQEPLANGARESEGTVSRAQLHETFDVLPDLIEVLRDVLSAASHQEATRIGDISSSATAVKDKYAQALALLRTLPGTNSSLEQQENAIAEAKEELKRISAVVELYSNTLYRGTDEPRAEINDAFSRKNL